MTVYLLIYDVDHGSREDCNIFYSPIEVFADVATRAARIDILTKANADIGWREEDLELQTTADFEIPSQYLDDDDQPIDDYFEEDDEDDNENEGVDEPASLEEPAPEVDNGIQFGDELMNLSVEELMAALETKWETDEQLKFESLLAEPELTPEDCYYCAFTIDNPWGGEEDTSIVVVIPKIKYDGIDEPELVEVPYGLVPVVMTELQTGAFIYRGIPADAKEIMNRYGFVENIDFHKFCEDME